MLRQPFHRFRPAILRQPMEYGEVLSLVMENFQVNLRVSLFRPAHHFSRLPDLRNVLDRLSNLLGILAESALFASAAFSFGHCLERVDTEFERGQFPLQ